MTKHAERPGTLKKSLKLFLLIFVILLVPVTMDQLEVDRESVRMVGRVAAGCTLLLLGYGLFKKLLKVLGFVVVILIALAVLVSEGELDAPRVKEWFSGSAAHAR